jgi:hypothetical protein
MSIQDGKFDVKSFIQNTIPLNDTDQRRFDTLASRLDLINKAFSGMRTDGKGGVVKVWLRTIVLTQDQCSRNRNSQSRVRVRVGSHNCEIDILIDYCLNQNVQCDFEGLMTGVIAELSRREAKANRERKVLLKECRACILDIMGIH